MEALGSTHHASDVWFISLGAGGRGRRCDPVTAVPEDPRPTRSSIVERGTALLHGSLKRALPAGLPGRAAAPAMCGPQLIRPAVGRSGQMNRNPPAAS